MYEKVAPEVADKLKNAGWNGPESPTAGELIEKLLKDNVSVTIYPHEDAGIGCQIPVQEGIKEAITFTDGHSLPDALGKLVAGYLEARKA